MSLKIIKQIGNTLCTEKRKQGYVTYEVECDCGIRFNILKKNFDENKHCRKCAYKIAAQKKTLPIELRKKKPPKRHLHHMKGTPFYKKWTSMKGRCKYSGVHGYKNYGGRGIKCLWNTFEEFRDDMYESYLEYCKTHLEKDVTLDRIDVDGNYCKENCRRLTMKEQQSTKRCNIKVEYNGKAYGSLKNLCEENGLNYPRVYRRIHNYGWSIKDALCKR